MIKYCECGCGQIVKNKRKSFIYGHIDKTKNVPTKYCKCGCGSEIIIKSYYKYHGIPDYIAWHRQNYKWKEIKDIVKYCKCGCKQLIEIRSWHKYRSIPDYINRHSERGKKRPPFSKEWKRNMSISGKNKKLSDEHKKKIGLGNKDKIVSEETKKKQSEKKTGKNHPNYGKFHSKETRKKQSISRIKGLISGKIVLSNNFKDTSIELAMEEQLKRNNFKYEKQKYIKNVGFVDFFLNDYNVILECDGDYFHNLEGAQQKDTDRDFKATLYHNYRTIRFWEHEINEDIKECIRKIKRAI